MFRISFSARIDIFALRCSAGGSVSRKALDLVREERHARDKWTALMIACKHNHMAIVRLLVDRGANVNLQNTSASFLCLVRADLRTMPCISRACARSLWIEERWDLSRVLFAAQVRIIDFSRYDSARESVWRCHIWGWSIDWFPEIASPSRGGWSGSMIAYKHGHDQIVEYLVEKGAHWMRIVRLESHEW